MRLAMAGNGRHHVINQIMPGHYLQTAAMTGTGPDVVRTIFKPLVAQAPEALARVNRSLLTSFPAQVADSISNRSRLTLLEIV